MSDSSCDRLVERLRSNRGSICVVIVASPTTAETPVERELYTRIARRCRSMSRWLFPISREQMLDIYIRQSAGDGHTLQILGEAQERIWFQRTGKQASSADPAVQAHFWQAILEWHLQRRHDRLAAGCAGRARFAVVPDLISAAADLCSSR